MMAEMNMHETTEKEYKYEIGCLEKDMTTLKNKPSCSSQLTDTDQSLKQK